MSETADAPIPTRLLVAALFGGVSALTLVALGRGSLAVAILAGTVTIALMLARPAIAGAVLAAASVTNAASVLTEFQGIPSITEPLMGIALLSVVIAVVRSADSPHLPSPILVLSFGGYAAAQLVSVYWAGDGPLASSVAIGTVSDMAVALIVVATIGSIRDLLVIAGGIASGGALLGLFSFHQALTGNYSSPYGGFAVATIEQIVGGLDDWRASGPFDDPNFFAQVLVVSFAVSLGFAVFTSPRSLRAFGAIGAAATGLGVVVTYSRGGLLALIGVCVCVVVLHRPTPIWTLGAIVLAILAITALPTELIERAAQSTAGLPLLDGEQPIADSAVRGRASEAIVGIQMFGDHPFGGVGVGNYPAEYQDYSRELGLDPRREDRKPHNLYLEIASETGLLGISTFAAIVALAVRSLRSARRRIETQATASLLAVTGVGLAISAIFLHAAFARTMWIVIALAATVGTLERARPQRCGALEAATRFDDALVEVET